MSGSLSNWVARHGHALVSTTGHLGRHGFATVLTVAVMGLALALPLALNVLVRNVRDATGDFSEAVGLSVFFKPEVAEEKARQLAKSAGERTGVASATLITASEALAEFRAQSGFGAALDALPANPLPNVLTIRPAPDATSPSQLEALRSYLLAWPEVDSVQLDRDWVLRFSAILELLRRVVLITAVLLGAGVIAVVGNTIRLEILNRSAEIAYDLAPAYWGRGIASAVCTAVTAWAFSHEDWVRVQATVLETNLRSDKVLKKCAYGYEGLLRAYRMVRGTPGNFRMYARVSEGVR